MEVSRLDVLLNAIPRAAESRQEMECLLLTDWRLPASPPLLVMDASVAADPLPPVPRSHPRGLPLTPSAEALDVIC